MIESCFEFTKIWEDDTFFEIRVIMRSLFSQVKLEFYTMNVDLERLNTGIRSISHFQANEFIWTSGEDTDTYSHFLQIRVFPYSKRGYLAFEIVVDNKSPVPEHMRATFYLTATLGSVDDFTVQLERMIQGLQDHAKGLAYETP